MRKGRKRPGLTHIPELFTFLYWHSISVFILFNYVTTIFFKRWMIPRVPFSFLLYSCPWLPKLMKVSSSHFGQRLLIGRCHQRKFFEEMLKIFVCSFAETTRKGHLKCNQYFFVKKLTYWLSRGSPMLMDHHFSQHHAGPQRVVFQRQQEINRPKTTICPRSMGWNIFLLEKIIWILNFCCSFTN